MLTNYKIGSCKQTRSTYKSKQDFGFKSALGVTVGATVVGLFVLKNQVDTEKEYFKNGKKLKELEVQIKQYDPNYETQWVPFDKIGVLRRVKDAFFCDGINIGLNKKIEKAEEYLKAYQKKSSKLDISV